VTAPARPTQPTESSGSAAPRESVLTTRAIWRPLPDSTAGRVLIAVALAVAYSAGALFTFWYLDDPASGAVFFPAAGLAMGVLLLTPKSTWPLWLSVVAACELSVDVSQGQTVAMGLGFAAANVVEPLLGALAVRSAMQRRQPDLRGTLAIFLLLAVALAPVAGGVAGATVASLSGVDSAWWVIAAKWWLGDALGVLVLGTAVLAWCRRSPFEPRAPWPETTAMVVAAVSVTLLPALVFDRPTLYAALPVLLWAALRGGSRSVSAAAVGIAFAANWATVTGRVGELMSRGDDHVCARCRRRGRGPNRGAEPGQGGRPSAPCRRGRGGGGTPADLEGDP
jgi:integral membrane sensor domain MASE1